MKIILTILTLAFATQISAFKGEKDLEKAGKIGLKAAPLLLLA